MFMLKSTHRELMNQVRHARLLARRSDDAYDLGDIENVCYDDGFVEVKREVFDWLVETKREEPLLKIELVNGSSTPQVSYRGKTIKFKKSVKLEWETDNLDVGKLYYKIENYEMEDSMGIMTNSIEGNRKGFRQSEKGQSE